MEKVAEVSVPVGPDEVVIKEGLVSVVMPRSGLGSTKHGPSRSAPVFLNPAMELARDITVAVFPLLGDRFRKRVLDGLAGTGIRGLRIAREAPGAWGEVTLNDRNPLAFKAIQRNIALNGQDPATVRATKCHASSLLIEESFTYIDLDPYGTPVPFIDAAIQSSVKSVLAVTATDSAALTGSSPETCLRRYGARPQKCHYLQEAGLRTLIGFIVRHAARYDKAATPLLSTATDYYMRTYILLWDGAARAKESIMKLGHTTLNKDGSITTQTFADGAEHLPSKASKAWGPLWTGPLHDAELVKKLKVPAHSNNKKALEKMFEHFRGEANLMPMFYDMDEMARIYRHNPPKLETVLAGIREKGFKASRSSISPKGFKTDMPFDELVAFWNEV